MSEACPGERSYVRLRGVAPHGWSARKKRSPAPPCDRTPLVPRSPLQLTMDGGQLGAKQHGGPELQRGGPELQPPAKQASPQPAAAGGTAGTMLSAVLGFGRRGSNAVHPEPMPPSAAAAEGQDGAGQAGGTSARPRSAFQRGSGSGPVAEASNNKAGLDSLPGPAAPPHRPRPLSSRALTSGAAAPGGPRGLLRSPHPAWAPSSLLGPGHTDVDPGWGGQASWWASASKGPGWVGGGSGSRAAGGGGPRQAATAQASLPQPSIWPWQRNAQRAAAQGQRLPRVGPAAALLGSPSMLRAWAARASGGGRGGQARPVAEAGERPLGGPGAGPRCDGVGRSGGRGVVCGPLRAGPVVTGCGLTPVVGPVR
jgi:hypothetical protein